MRVATEHRLVAADPGQTVDVRVDVVNTGELIEGVTAHVIGLPDGQIAVEPQLLPLFPDAQGQITLSITVPSHQPAGVHPQTIRTKRAGRFVLTVHNSGNVALSATLTAAQEDQRTRTWFSPEMVTVEPGAAAPVILGVKGPRMVTGSEVDRMVNVGL